MLYPFNRTYRWLLGALLGPFVTHPRIRMNGGAVRLILALAFAFAFSLPACSSPSSSSTTPAAVHPAESVDDAGADPARPAASKDAASAPAPARSAAPKIVLFGGSDVPDTWEWDGSAWTQRTANGPSPRAHVSMTTLGGNVLMAGGTTPPSSYPLDFPWTWDGSAWSAHTRHPPTEHVAMASLGKTAYLMTELGAFGAFDGDTWTQVDGRVPPARTGAPLATLNGKLVMFGGEALGSGDFLADTWEFDGATWKQRDVPGPPATSRHALATLNGKVVMFGGLVWSSTVFAEVADTWEWDGDAWTKLDVQGPPPRSWHAMATLNEKVVLFGGTGTPARADTWEWDGNAWTERNVVGPSARFGHAMASYQQVLSQL